MNSFTSIVLAIAISAGTLMAPSSAEAGPLLDWLRGLRNKNRLCQRNTGCNTCQNNMMGGATVAQANPYNLQPGQCATTCNQTCSRTVVNYVPVTAYRCDWEQVPVTQYKPVTNTDPCTGCTVTCMKPCTTYTWQMKQQPYTTYKPVYRTENYTVPVTTITNSGDCATCNTGVPTAPGCATCGIPGQTPVITSPSIPGQNAPVYGNPQPSSGYPYPESGNVIMAPNGTITTSGGFSSPSGSSLPTPADQVPEIRNVNPQTMQQPIIDRLRAASRQRQVSPRYSSLPGGVTADQLSNRSEVESRWGYSPVRLASHEEVVNSNKIDGSWQLSNPNAPPSASGWRNAGW